MEYMGTGLAAFAFWGFIAAVVVAGIWDGIRKRDARHETIRKIIESGADVSDHAVERLLAAAENKNDTLARDLRVGSYICLCLAPGIAIFGFFLGITGAMVGVGVLLASIGIGLRIAATKIDDDTNSRSL